MTSVNTVGVGVGDGEGGGERRRGGGKKQTNGRTDMQTTESVDQLTEILIRKD